MNLLQDYKDFIEFRSEMKEIELELVGFQGLELTKTPELEKFDPTLVTQSHKWLEQKGWVAFIHQNQSDIQWKYCKFDQNLTLESCSAPEQKNFPNDLDVIRSLNTSQQMIAIFPIIREGSEDFIVLFKDDTSIVWCAAHNSNHSYESKCENSDRQILIECDNNNNNNNLLYVILIIIAILALLVAIPIILWAVYTKLNRNDVNAKRKPF